jgi:hypothetical protein
MAIVFRMTAGLLGWFALALQYGLVLAGDFDTGPIVRTINLIVFLFLGVILVTGGRLLGNALSIDLAD